MTNQLVKKKSRRWLKSTPLNQDPKAKISGPISSSATKNEKPLELKNAVFINTVEKENTKQHWQSQSGNDSIYFVDPQPETSLDYNVITSISHIKEEDMTYREFPNSIRRHNTQMHKPSITHLFSHFTLKKQDTNTSPVSSYRGSISSTPSSPISRNSVSLPSPRHTLKNKTSAFFSSLQPTFKEKQREPLPMNIKPIEPIEPIEPIDIDNVFGTICRESNFFGDAENQFDNIINSLGSGNGRIQKDIPGVSMAPSCSISSVPTFETVSELPSSRDSSLRRNSSSSSLSSNYEPYLSISFTSQTFDPSEQLRKSTHTLTLASGGKLNTELPLLHSSSKRSFRDVINFYNINETHIFGDDDAKDIFDD